MRIQRDGRANESTRAHSLPARCFTSLTLHLATVTQVKRPCAGLTEAHHSHMVVKLVRGVSEVLLGCEGSGVNA